MYLLCGTSMFAWLDREESCTKERRKQRKQKCKMHTNGKSNLKNAHKYVDGGEMELIRGPYTKLARSRIVEGREMRRKKSTQAHTHTLEWMKWKTVACLINGQRASKFSQPNQRGEKHIYLLQVVWIWYACTFSKKCQYCALSSIDRNEAIKRREREREGEKWA